MNARVEYTKRDTIIHIFDIETDMNEQNVKEAILRVVRGCKEEDVKIISIKPNMVGNQNAMLSVDRSTARELAKNGTIRIGWAPCKVRERINITRCFRCVEFWHRRGKCKGADNTKKCLNCAQEGHIAKECIDGSHYTTCMTEGQMAR
nr:uncharacterized protein LOC111508870 [Leptinotarsa decemlineata]